MNKAQRLLPKHFFKLVSVGLVLTVGVILQIWHSQNNKFEDLVARNKMSSIKGLPEKTKVFFDSMEGDLPFVQLSFIENLSNYARDQRLEQKFTRNEFMEIINRIITYCYSHKSSRYRQCLNDSISNGSLFGSMKSTIDNLPISRYLDKDQGSLVDITVWSICLKIGHYECLDRLLKKYQGQKVSIFEIEKPLLALRSQAQLKIEADELIKTLKSLLNNSLKDEVKISIHYGLSVYYSSLRQNDLCLLHGKSYLNLLSENMLSEGANPWRIIQIATCQRSNKNYESAVRVLKKFRTGFSSLSLREKMFYNLELVVNKILARVSIEDADTGFRKDDFKRLSLEEETLLRGFYSSIREIDPQPAEIGVNEFLNNNGEQSEYGIYFKSLLSDLKRGLSGKR